MVDWVLRVFLPCVSVCGCVLLLSFLTPITSLIHTYTLPHYYYISLYIPTPTTPPPCYKISTLYTSEGGGLGGRRIIKVHGTSFCLASELIIQLRCS